MPKEIIVPKGILKDEHISHIEEILNIYITFKEDTYINDLVDEDSDNNINIVKEENTKKDGIDEKIEEFEKALTEKIVTRYNIIERNEISEEETIIEEERKLEKLFGKLNDEQLLFLSNLKFKYFRLGCEITESIEKFKVEINI